MSRSDALILGIESSCDETAAAVVQGGCRVLSSAVASQHDLHAEYRGVVPEIASRAHAEQLLPIVRRALDEAGVALDQIDAVSVGHRPGLIGSLLVGVAGAKALAWSLGVPLVGVDHVHAHLHAGCLDVEPATFPALGLVVSGGHSSLYTLSSILDVRPIGKTIDDAVGEAYDKVATILDLPYPGGPNLDKLAREGDAKAYDFPVSRLGRESLDFSFSGLKTAVLYAVRGTPAPPERPGMPRREGTPGFDLSDRDACAAVAASFQRVAVKAVMLKLERALAVEPDAKTLLVGGGVSANSHLREELTRFGETRGIDVRLPKMAYCIDNAAMIAGLAWHQLEANDWAGDALSLRATPTTAC